MSSTKKYDFKTTNGNDKKMDNPIIYRGMPIGKTANNITIYASARDIGNYAAGYMAGVNGIPYTYARFAFDAYQIFSTMKPEIEGISTQNAERLGWERGYKEAPLVKKAAVILIRSFLGRTVNPLLYF